MRTDARRRAEELLVRWTRNGWLARMDFDDQIKFLAPELAKYEADAVVQAVKERDAMWMRRLPAYGTPEFDAKETELIAEAEEMTDLAQLREHYVCAVLNWSCVLDYRDQQAEEIARLRVQVSESYGVSEIKRLESLVDELHEEIAQFRAALQHEVYRNHEHTDACPACQQSDEALRAGGEQKGNQFMCSARRNGRDDGDPCMKIEGHDGAHKFVKIRPLRAGEGK